VEIKLRKAGINTDAKEICFSLSVDEVEGINMK